MPVAPIIQSLLDTDYYKLTMEQVVWLYYRGVEVTYETINRTKTILLARFIREDDLRRELDHVRTLSFQPDELAYLKTLGIFKDDYLSFLAGMRLPPYDLRWGDDSFSLRFSGPWESAIFWEIPGMSIIKELYIRSLMSGYSETERQAVYDRGKATLAGKLQMLREYPDIFVSDFATRRRNGRIWHHDTVLPMLICGLPHQLLGTSNVHCARRYGVKPIGTFAHEMLMIVAGLRQGHPGPGYLAEAQNEILQYWWDTYGYDLSIALNDTFSSDFFFRTAPEKIARDWKGIRIDSGDPLEEGEKCVRWYEAHGVNPATKTLVFSDGLDVPTMIRIAARFRGRIKFVFGWGTNLSDDMGFAPISLVIKAIEANGIGLVKTSNNRAKATGRPEDIERVIQEAGYAGNFRQECVY